MPLVRRRAAGLHLGQWLGLSPTGVAAVRHELHRLLPDSPDEVSKIHVTVAAANVLLRQAGPAPAELPLHVGESAAVYSRSAGSWLPGRVVAFERGGKGAKHCLLCSVDLAAAVMT